MANYGIKKSESDLQIFISSWKSLTGVLWVMQLN